jgi:hypothetical protein
MSSRSSKRKAPHAANAEGPTNNHTGSYITRNECEINNAIEQNCEKWLPAPKSDDPNALTVLTACSGRLNKIIKKDGTVIGYDNARMFSARSVSVATRKELVALLTELNGQEGSAIVHGAVVDGTNQRRMRRLLHDQDDGDKATLRDVPRHVHALDIENIFPPYGFDLHDLQAAAQYVRDALPDELRGASYVAVASSSYLIKPGLRFHFWVRTDKPLTCKQLKRWLEWLKAPIDVSPLNGAGITYTACPGFEDQAADPLPGGRVAVLKGRACVTVPDYVFALTDRGRGEDNDPCCVEIDTSNVGDRERAHAAKKLQEVAEELENTDEGERNTKLNAIAYAMGRMVGAGWIDYDEVRDALLEASTLPDLEARALLRRVIRTGMRLPRKSIDEFVNPWEERREVFEKDGELFDAKTGEAILTITPEDASDDVPSTGDYADEILKLPGLVTDVANFVLSAAQVPQKRFAVAAGLTVVGMAAARHLKTPTWSQLNTYMLMVTQSANGKNDPLRAAKSILRAAELEGMIGPSGCNSDMAIYLHCNDQPVTLMVIDEFGEILAANNASSASSHAQKLNAAFKIMWDGGSIPVPKSACRAHMVLDDPYLSLLCATTPGRFYGAVGGKEVADGTLNRILVINVETLEPFNEIEKDINDIPPELAERVRKLADRSGPDFRVKSVTEYYRLDGVQKPTTTIVPWGKGAREMWHTYRHQCRDLANKDNCGESLGARCFHNALKVATILAISENPSDPVVYARHVKLGILLAEASLRDMTRGYEQNVGDSKTADLQERVLGRIRKAKGGVISRRELFGSLRKVRHHAKIRRHHENTRNGGRDRGSCRKAGRSRPSWHIFQGSPTGVIVCTKLCTGEFRVPENRRGKNCVHPCVR